MQPRAPRTASVAGIDLTRSGVTIPRFVSMHMLGAIFPITAGLLLFGWRALAVLLIVVGSAAVGTLMWQSIGKRGARVRMESTLWFALLLAMSLPAHLASTFDAVSGTKYAPWPILVGAGLALSGFVWMLGGAGAGKIHPVLIAILLLVVLFQDMLSPRFTLRRERALFGDVLDVPEAEIRVTTRPSLAPPEPTEQARPAWIASDPYPTNHQAIRTSAPAAEKLESFTSGHQMPERSRISLESLVRDRLPPLEDLIVGGQPGPIGQSSAIAVIIGGLFLLYRGLIDFRVPLLIILSAFVGLLVLPVPVVITESERIMRWYALGDKSVGSALAVTFANYEMMASPLLFVAFFLATAPAVRPLVRRARFFYAVLIGVSAAAFQIYVSVTIGPYLALLAVSLLSPTLERIFKPRALI